MLAMDLFMKYYLELYWGVFMSDRVLLLMFVSNLLSYDILPCLEVPCD